MTARIDRETSARNPLRSTSIRLVLVEADSYMKRTLACLDVSAMYDVASASLGIQEEQKERWKRLIRHESNANLTVGF